MCPKMAMVCNYKLYWNWLCGDGQVYVQLCLLCLSREFNVVLKPDSSYFQKGFKVYKDGEEHSRSNAMMYSYAGRLAGEYIYSANIVHASRL